MHKFRLTLYSSPIKSCHSVNVSFNVEWMIFSRKLFQPHKYIEQTMALLGEVRFSFCDCKRMEFYYELQNEAVCTMAFY